MKLTFKSWRFLIFKHGMKVVKSEFEKSKNKKYIPSIIGILTALVGIDISIFVLKKILPTHSFYVKIWQGIASEWILGIGILLIVLFWEKESLNSIGIQKMKISDIGWGAIGFIVGFLTFAATAPVLKAFHLNTTSAVITKLADLSLLGRVLIVMTAGICEEVLYRGYAIERLNRLTGNLWISAFISWFVFTAGHLWLWGLAGALQISIWAIVVTLLYVWRRNLWVCIIMHILNDGFAFIVIPLLIHHP